MSQDIVTTTANDVNSDHCNRNRHLNADGVHSRKLNCAYVRLNSPRANGPEPHAQIVRVGNY